MPAPDDGPLPSTADIDAVLAHLPALERPGTAGDWRSSWYGGPEVRQLQLALSRHGFVIAFDGSSWQPQAELYQRDPAALAHASLADLCKLLTVHVRTDRFVAGHFASAVQSGQIAAILRRLKVLRDDRAPA
jgi:hypothetical protein